MIKKAAKFLIFSTILLLGVFVGSDVWAEHIFVEYPPLFYLARNHLYLEVEATEFDPEHVSLYYIYENEAYEEYEFGVAEYEGAEICEIARQDSSNTYFHCIFQDLPNRPFDRLVASISRTQGSETKTLFTVGYVTPPEPTGIPNHAVTFEYSNTFADADEDGFDDEIDNCVQVPNPNQLDEDGDGMGDACPFGTDLADQDGDGIPDIEDNCTKVANPDQADHDDDGKGTACDDTPCPGEYQILDPQSHKCVDNSEDSDQDGIPDELDNCPSMPNEDQKNSDADGFGDACDLCLDFKNDVQTERVEALCEDTDLDGVADFDDICIGMFDPSNASAECVNFTTLTTSLNAYGRKGGNCSLLPSAAPNLMGYFLTLLSLLIIRLIPKDNSLKK